MCSPESPFGMWSDSLRPTPERRSVPLRELVFLGGSSTRLSGPDRRSLPCLRSAAQRNSSRSLSSESQPWINDVVATRSSPGRSNTIVACSDSAFGVSARRERTLGCQKAHAYQVWPSSSTYFATASPTGPSPGERLEHAMQSMGIRRRQQSGDATARFPGIPETRCPGKPRDLSGVDLRRLRWRELGSVIEVAINRPSQIANRNLKSLRSQRLHRICARRFPRREIARGQGNHG